MPIYEYTCEACGKIFEEFKFTAGRDEKTQCPFCGSEETRRVASSFSSSSGSCESTAASCGTGRKGGFT
jgi:putative FmdB family regulatory protein